MLAVPLCNGNQFLGLLVLVNKRYGPFDRQDQELLRAIGQIIVFKWSSRVDQNRLDRSSAKENASGYPKEVLVQTLSHELKTPLAVLSASVKILEKGQSRIQAHERLRIYARIERSLQRLLDFEYRLEDLLRKGDHAFSATQNKKDGNHKKDEHL